jgi:hypothetical protein
MKVPESSVERLQLYVELIRKCTASREERRSFYRMMRAYYLFGTDEQGLQDMGGRYNKIFSHMEQLSSFMFSPETTRFNIDLGVSVPADEQFKVEAMTERLHEAWHGKSEGGIDDDFKIALEWSGVYGSMFVKLRPKLWENEDGSKGFQLQHFLVEPHNLGLLREDRYGLYRQEAFCETYMITKSQLANELEAGMNARKDEIIANAQAGAWSNTEQISAGPIDRLIVTSIQGGSITGNASFWATPLATMYRPTTIEDMVELTELYVYDDAIADWRVVTFMKPSYPIWDRPLGKIFVSRVLPYIQVCPLPTHDYAWGHSAVEKLVPLQDMRNERIADIRHLLKKQAHSPFSMTGISAIPDEMQMALDTPSGIMTADSPVATVKEHQPTIPADLWHDVDKIDEMMDETSGLSAINQGKGEKGVRSQGQAQTLSQLGSTRSKSKALIVENSLDAVATTIVCILRRYDKRPMREDRTDSPAQFFANQFPEDFVAKVDGHSSSPVFLENYEAKIFKLLELQAIDREEALKLLDIPRKQQLLHKLKSEIEPAEQRAKEEENNIKKLSILSKRQAGGNNQSAT